MSLGPHKKSIEPGDSARRAEQGPHPAPFRRIDGGTAARDAEQRSYDTSIGRTVHGFTLSARVGKPFKFENGVPAAAGEAMPAESPASAPEIQIKKTNQTQNEKPMNVAAPEKPHVADSSAISFPGSFLRALFRRRFPSASPENDT
ncbi:MAG TPA: hypothetical protein VFA02_13825 [Pseudacidobacterium sp.]|nr:hypothetical protein [Pseudacidobacterium sp.]